MYKRRGRSQGSWSIAWKPRRGRASKALISTPHYRDWCEDNSVRALAAPQFADALVPVLNEVGIKRKMRGDDVFLVGVKLAS
jgi:hypothetical protein